MALHQRCHIPLTPASVRNDTEQQKTANYGWSVLCRVALKGDAVRLGREVQEAPKVQAQCGRRTEATAGGNALDGVVRGFQQALGESDALLEEPVIGAGAQRGAEAAGEGARTHDGAGRHRFNGEVFVQVGGHPAQRGAEGVFFGDFDQRRFDILRLAAGALRGHDHAPGQGGGDGGSVVLAHDVQREVDGGSGSGGGEDLPVVDEQDAGINLDPGVTGCQFGGPAPMGGDAPTIQQSGFGQQERARAEGEDARSALIGEAQGIEQGWGNRHHGGTWAGDNEDVGLGSVREQIGGREHEARKGVNGARLGGAEQEAIPGDAQFGTFHGKDLGGHAQFKGIDVVIDDGGDGMHGGFLLLSVYSTTGRASLCMARL
jgi:hypothetical protein